MVHLCPDCLRKLQWNLGFDVAQHYEDVCRFDAHHGLTEEAEWIERRLGRLQGTQNGTPTASAP